MDNNKRDYVRPEDEKIVLEIETIRVRNNTNWMDVLRIALREAPGETKSVLKDIVECDIRIHNKLKELSER